MTKGPSCARAASVFFFEKQHISEKIEEDGFDAVKAVLEELGGMPLLEGEAWGQEGEWKWTATVAALARKGLSYGSVIGINVREDEKFSIHIIDPMLGINRKYLVKGREDAVVEAYFNFMVEMATLLGAEGEEKIQTQVEDILDLEIELAQASRCERAKF